MRTRAAWIAALAWSATILTMAAAPAPAQDEDEMPPTITVSGSGKVSAAPDVAEVNVGVSTQAPTADAALAENNRVMARLVDAIKGRGIAAKDVQTSQLQIYPQYTQPQPGQNRQGEFVPRVAAYQVTNTVQITSRKLDALGGLLDALVGAGANQIQGISFRVGEPEKLLDEARKRAMADAKRKAEILAGEAGVVVGSPRQIIESGGMPMPMPRPMMRMAGGAMMAAAPEMSISPGEQDLQVSVQVVYDLKAPK